MTVTELQHVLVLSDDLEATRGFYCRVVGLEVGERPPLAFPGYWLYAGSTPCLHLAERGAYLAHASTVGLAAPASGTPVDHIAFGAGDYGEACARLQRDGVAAVQNDVPGADLRQLFFEDPNGVRVEINVTNRR